MCALMDKWINKIWYIYKMKYYATLRRPEILTHTTIWLKLEDTLVSEINHSQKDKYSVKYLYEVLRVVKFLRQKVEGCQGLGGEE